MVKTVGVLILLLVVLFFLIAFFVPSIGHALGITGIFGNVGWSNTEVVVNACERVCEFDNNRTAFCYEPIRRWDVGNGMRIEGSCYAISEVDLGIPGGVKGCGYACGNVEPAVCYFEKKEVLCDSLHERL